MAPMVETVRRMLFSLDPRQPEASCLICGATVRSGQPVIRLRDGGHAHRECATYRRRSRGGRLGYPR
jgi:hypothetical protein